MPCQRFLCLKGCYGAARLLAGAASLRAEDRNALCALTSRRPSILDTWLSFTSTSWGSAIIAGILCSVGLFLLSLHFHPSDLYSPSSRNIRKCHLQPREKNRRRKRGAALRGCRGRLREQELASSLISHVECHQSRTPDRSHDHRSHQDTLGENKPQSLIRTEIRHPERPTLQKQLERQRALSSGVKRPQEVCSVPTSTRPEDSRVAAMLPENLPISPEMRKVLEQHLQEQFIRPPWELPGKIRKTLEQVRLQGPLHASGAAKYESHRRKKALAEQSQWQWRSDGNGFQATSDAKSIGWLVLRSWELLFPFCHCLLGSRGLMPRQGCFTGEQSPDCKTGKLTLSLRHLEPLLSPSRQRRGTGGEGDCVTSTESKK
ncbi:Spermatogenesis-associated protein 31A3 [Manis javanica]|nr:Spermatogenesis-associated protein 31A3 [Manis javanica]